MNPNTLRKHSVLWQVHFRKEWLLLRLFLRGKVIDIQHVGSTAIAGMPARPIIDILVGVSDYEKAAVYVSTYEQVGYEYLGQDDVHRKYYLEKEGTPSVQLYMLETTNEEWERKIFLRDFLIKDKVQALAYLNLKFDLSARFPENIQDYQTGKREFFERILKLRSLAA